MIPIRYPFNPLSIQVKVFYDFYVRNIKYREKKGHMHYKNNKLNTNKILGVSLCLWFMKQSLRLWI